MKKISIITIAIFALAATSLQAQPAPAPNAAALNTLTIQVQGVGEKSGQLMLSVCRQDEYDKGDRCQFGAIVPNSEFGKPIIINDIPNGTYAVKMMHDVNGNNRLDTNSMGIPREPYAFSNNARGRFGPAKFEDAAFVIDKSTDISIRLSQ